MATRLSCRRTRRRSSTTRPRLPLVIGKEAKNLTEENAMDAIFGYTVFNDVSARGLGAPEVSSFLGKSFDTFAGFGPWIVTPDEIDDPHKLHVTVEVDGELRQDYNTSDMERQIPELLTYISSVTTLRPGDVICCGTNHQGLGAMQDGDTVVTGIEGIGKFALHVKDSEARGWQRGIDEEMAERIQSQCGESRPSAGRTVLMKLVHTAEFGIGVQREDGVVDVSAVFEDIPYRSGADRMPRVLAVFQERRDQLEKLAASADVAPNATLLAPVPRPPKLIAAFRNYFEGVDRERREQDMFLESPDSVLDPGGTVVLPNHPATIFHHEAELGLVIGRRCKGSARR